MHILTKYDKLLSGSSVTCIADTLKWSKNINLINYTKRISVSFADENIINIIECIFRSDSIKGSLMRNINENVLPEENGYNKLKFQFA